MSIVSRNKFKITKKDVEVNAKFNEEELAVLYKALNYALSGGELKKEQWNLGDELRCEIASISKKLQNNIWYDK